MNTTANIVTGSSKVHQWRLRQIDRGDAKEQLPVGGIASRTIWRVFEDCQDFENENQGGNQPSKVSWKCRQNSV